MWWIDWIGWNGIEVSGGWGPHHEFVSFYSSSSQWCRGDLCSMRSKMILFQKALLLFLYHGRKWTVRNSIYFSPHESSHKHDPSTSVLALLGHGGHPPEPSRVGRHYVLYMYFWATAPFLLVSTGSGGRIKGLCITETMHQQLQVPVCYYRNQKLMLAEHSVFDMFSMISMMWCCTCMVWHDTLPVLPLSCG